LLRVSLTRVSCRLRWLTRGAQLLFARSPEVCAERMARALLGPERGFVVADQEGRPVAPMPEMTEQRRAAVYSHCADVVRSATLLHTQ
jgi:hypothetical protein